MSENVLKIIPMKGDYAPSVRQQVQARDLISDFLPNAEAIVVELTNSIEFVDQGTNFEQVKCPLCHSILSIDWWQETMDRAYSMHFDNLAIETPCCASSTSLNDLDYEWPAGFSRFKIEIRSPRSELTEKLFADLESLLGCKLRQIWAHY
jgi:hypothetical protein